MSTTIDSENLKKIRTPFEVYCGISAENTTASETISDIGGISPHTVALEDTNATTSLKKSGWNAVQLADLSGGGFPLDAGVVFPEASHTGDTDEKYGVQSEPGGSFKLTVNTSATSISITATGTGAVIPKWGGQVRTPYAIKPQFTLQVPQNTDVELSFINTTNDARIVVYSVVPGVVMSFDNSSLVSVVLDLAGNLSKESPSFEVSSIEIQAHYQNDISQVISAVADNAPLWYYAGYAGDYCETRNFYLSEEATQKNNVITLRGVDASGKLAERQTYAKAMQAGKTTALGLYNLYIYMKSVITGAGVKLTNFQSMTNPGGTYNSGEWVVAVEQSAQDLIGAIMLQVRDGQTTFWPTYVDAGIPTLYNKMVSSDGTYKSPYQLRVWEINEADCADVERHVERHINTVRNDDEEEYFYSKLTWVGLDESTSGVVERSEDQTIGAAYSFSSDDYFGKIVVSNASKVYSETANAIKWIASKVTSLVYGYRLAKTPYLPFDSYIGSRPGITIKVTPSFVGMFKKMSGAGYVSLNDMRFMGSNVTGSFTFKGDPRMQPRDTFKFIRLDGTTEIATIERIELTHEGGGTTAELHYRLGVW